MNAFQSSQLSNGVIVLTETMPHTRGVGISLLVDAGPQDESQQQSGLAHLCEHAFFLGTSSRSEQQIAELIDTAGGQLGGFTARDYTCLHATISADYVTYAMDLLGDIIINSAYPDQRLQREIEVIGHEIDAHDDDVDISLDAALKQKMWAGDPLGRSMLGTRRSISGLAKSDVLGFVNEHYTADRVVVAAAGQIDHDDFVEQANDSFWQLSGVDCRTRRGPAVPKGGVLIRAREQRRTMLNVMLPAPVYADSDRYDLHVLVALLGGGMSSRLYRHLRERAGLVYSVSAGLHAYGRGGVISIEASTTPESATHCLHQIIDQLVQLAHLDDAITEEELWKAKMQVRGQTYLASDSIATRVSRLATQQLYFGSPLDSEKMLEKIDAVDLDSVCRVARRVLGAGLARMAIGIAGGVCEDQAAIYEEVAGLTNCFNLSHDESLEHV